MDDKRIERMVRTGKHLTYRFKNFASEDNTLLHNTCLSYKSMWLLVESGLDVNAVNSIGDTPLSILFRTKKCSKGDAPDYLDKVKLLINMGADVNIPCGGGWTVLHTACTDDDEEAIRILLKARADPNALTETYKATPLVKYIETHRQTASVELVREFLVYGANPTLSDWNAVRTAKEFKAHPSIVSLLEEWAAAPLPDIKVAQ